MIKNLTIQTRRRIQDRPRVELTPEQQKAALVRILGVKKDDVPVAAFQSSI